MEDAKTYQDAIADVVAKQMVILGPGVALATARGVKGLTIDDNGTVTAIEGEPQKVFQSVIDAYVALSGQIVKTTLQSVFTKYPNLQAG